MWRLCKTYDVDVALMSSFWKGSVSFNHHWRSRLPDPRCLTVRRSLLPSISGARNWRHSGLSERLEQQRR